MNTEFLYNSFTILALVWYICYKWWTNIDILLIIVYISVHSVLYTLWVLICVCHVSAVNDIIIQNSLTAFPPNSPSLTYSSLPLSLWTLATTDLFNISIKKFCLFQNVMLVSFNMHLFHPHLFMANSLLHFSNK